MAKADMVGRYVPGTTYHSTFEPVNFQPEKAEPVKKNACPHYKLLYQAAELLGIEKEIESTETFCGLTVNTAYIPGNMLPKVNKVPHAYCWIILSRINHAITCVELGNEEAADYLELWAKNIPPIGGKKPRERTKKELLSYIERLAQKVEDRAYGRLTEIKAGQPLPGCHQQPKEHQSLGVHL